MVVFGQKEMGNFEQKRPPSRPSLILKSKMGEGAGSWRKNALFHSIKSCSCPKYDAPQSYLGQVAGGLLALNPFNAKVS
jgi:hypothetical protein